MAQKIRGFWFRICGMLVAMFCLFSGTKTSMADDTPQECKYNGAPQIIDDENNETYEFLIKGDECYLKGNKEIHYEDNIGEYYYPAQAYCSESGNWYTVS